VARSVFNALTESAPISRPADIKWLSQDIAQRNKAEFRITAIKAVISSRSAFFISSLQLSGTLNKYLERRGVT